MREAKHAPFRIFDVLAKDNPSRVFLETGAQDFIHRVPDAIFPRRQDLLVDLRGCLGDVSEKLVRRWVLIFLRFTILAANALLDFIIQPREFLSGDHAFLNQLIFPVPEGITFFQFP